MRDLVSAEDVDEDEDEDEEERERVTARPTGNLTRHLLVLLFTVLTVASMSYSASAKI